MPIVKTNSGVKHFPYTGKGKVAAKKAVLKKYTGKGGPITPGNFPTRSKKNSDGEIINPTKSDVSRFNRRFNTTIPMNRAVTPEESKERIAAEMRRINQEDMNKIDLSDMPSPFEMIGRAAKRVGRGIRGAAYKTFVAPSVRYKKIQKIQDDKYRREGEALKAGFKSGSRPSNKYVSKKRALKRAVRRGK